MQIAVDIHRHAADSLGLPASQGSTHLDWHLAELPQVGDRIARPGAVWVVRARSWGQGGDLTLLVEEFPR